MHNVKATKLANAWDSITKALNVEGMNGESA